MHMECVDDVALRKYNGWTVAYLDTLSRPLTDDFDYSEAAGVLVFSMFLKLISFLRVYVSRIVLLPT